MPILTSPDAVRSLLSRTSAIAVVGLSADPSRDSHEVSAYMKSHGYRIVGVNPKYAELLGEPAYPSLDDIPEEILREIDLVNVFRRPEEAESVALTAARLKLPAIWFQLGVATPEAIAAAEDAGLAVVADSCIKVAHRFLLRRS